MYENKGTVKMQLMISGLGGQSACGMIQFPTSHPPPLSLVPYPLSRSTKMKVHPAIFMKTKDRENARWIDRAELAGEAPEMILIPGWEGVGEHESISRPRTRSPQPTSPLNCDDWAGSNGMGLTACPHHSLVVTYFSALQEGH
jgi:hypothetical protein